MTKHARPATHPATHPATRPATRAAKLHQQALNCLTIAMKEEAHSAELIDEALKLAKRSRELSEVE
ncbi:hypothetical protein ACFOKI_08015 [Sphingomonas qilianensis]|uniref:Uncharacterized protein n=1 Tax=Sphingomonas qilianensis TaxID=1736690 RepID=A0ABU9XT76_9SPHN